MRYRFTDTVNDEYVDVEFSQQEILEILEDYAYNKLYNKQQGDDSNFPNLEAIEFVDE